MLQAKGWKIALAEVALFFLGAHMFRGTDDLSSLNYYWFCFTSLVGFWEYVYISNFNEVSAIAEKLVLEKKSVWFSDYPLYYINPYYFSILFYAEYAANADREYKSHRKYDYWSRLIESSHAMFCAGFCLASLFVARENLTASMMIGLIAMGAQFMNSYIYMAEYFMQCWTTTSPNYSSNSFPLGLWMLKRPFMWINAMWLFFPILICSAILKMQFIASEAL